jgi:hypothetical protein
MFAGICNAGYRHESGKKECDQQSVHLKSPSMGESIANWLRFCTLARF